MAASNDIPRFDRVTRWVHWTTAALFACCLLTAVALYVGPVATAIGRRPLVSAIHVYAGFALPVPALLGLLARAFRANVQALERFGRHDWRWLRSKHNRLGHLPIGKFNAGQKLNAAFTCGAILVMLGTGLMLWYPDPWPVQLRTGATFVHDWLALAFLVVVLGHLWFASRDGEARRGMRTGRVRKEWAWVEHPGWAAENEPTATGEEPQATHGPPRDRQ